MDLCVIVLTNELNKTIQSPKYQPKVCYHLGNKSILEICLDQWIQLNPKRIILMVSKKEIQQINRIVKYLNYSKDLSYSIFDSGDNKHSLKCAKSCYEDYNVLVVPGNAPKLTSKSLFKYIKKSQSFKINNKIFFLNKLDIELIDTPEKLPEIYIEEADTEMIETQRQYDILLAKYNKHPSWTQKMWSKLKRKNKGKS
jgi:bifunctional N-acetylglucosamine-1-phosphate-uridyltransferase/glucosamine-1-phosphate-acetyltransferase GlmU-like protein